MRQGPVDPGRRADWRRARRQVARRLHPDLGGDPHEYLAAMAAVDQAFGIPTPGGTQRTDISVARSRRLRHSLVRVVRAGGRRGQARLPRRVPGSRRYIDL